MALPGLKPSIEFESDEKGVRLVERESGTTLTLSELEAALLRAWDGVVGASALADLVLLQGLSVEPRQVEQFFARLERSQLLVTAAPLVPYSSASSPGVESEEDAVPLLRSDLVITPSKTSRGTREVMDPTCERSFTLYDFEVSIARMLDGRRTAGEVIAASNRLGIPVTLATLRTFLQQLRAYQFIDLNAAPAGDSTWAPRKQWTVEVRELYQSALRLMRAGRFDEARSYVDAIAAADPANDEAVALRQRIDAEALGSGEMNVPFDELHTPVSTAAVKLDGLDPTVSHGEAATKFAASTTGSGSEAAAKFGFAASTTPDAAARHGDAASDFGFAASTPDATGSHGEAASKFAASTTGSGSEAAAKFGFGASTTPDAAARHGDAATDFGFAASTTLDATASHGDAAREFAASTPDATGNHGDAASKFGFAASTTLDATASHGDAASDFGFAASTPDATGSHGDAATEFGFAASTTLDATASHGDAAREFAASTPDATASHGDAAKESAASMTLDPAASKFGFAASMTLDPTASKFGFAAAPLPLDVPVPQKPISLLTTPYGAAPVALEPVSLERPTAPPKPEPIRPISLRTTPYGAGPMLSAPDPDARIVRGGAAAELLDAGVPLPLTEAPAPIPATTPYGLPSASAEPVTAPAMWPESEPKPGDPFASFGFHSAPPSTETLTPMPSGLYKTVPAPEVAKRSSKWPVVVGLLVVVLISAGVLLRPVEVRRSIPCELRADVLGAAVAPREGVVKAAEVKHGDVVEAGAVLARLEYSLDDAPAVFDERIASVEKEKAALPKIVPAKLKKARAAVKKAELALKVSQKGLARLTGAKLAAANKKVELKQRALDKAQAAVEAMTQDAKRADLARRIVELQAEKKNALASRERSAIEAPVGGVVLLPSAFPVVVKASSEFATLVAPTLRVVTKEELPADVKGGTLRIGSTEREFTFARMKDALGVVPLKPSLIDASATLEVSAGTKPWVLTLR